MFLESKKNFIEELEKLRKQLKQEQLLKAQAVNKLAEIMNRKDNTTKGKSKVSSADLRKKEKECRKLQLELTQVCNKLKEEKSNNKANTIDLSINLLIQMEKRKNLCILI